MHRRVHVQHHAAPVIWAVDVHVSRSVDVVSTLDVIVPAVCQRPLDVSVTPAVRDHHGAPWPYDLDAARSARAMVDGGAAGGVHLPDLAVRSLVNFAAAAGAVDVISAGPRGR